MTCPVPSAHRRLDDAHAAWHDALDAYTDPHGFRRHLNSFLAAFGSTKDLIDRRKRRLPLGVEKLKEWESEAAQFPAAAWARSSRNLVIHEDDLNLYSWAEIEFVDPITFTSVAPGRRIPPQRTTEELLASVLQAGIPHNDRRVIAVTRKWVADTLPHVELLSACSVLYSLLCVLLEEFHEPDTDCSELHLPVRSCNRGMRNLHRPDCMVASPPNITRYFDTKSERELAVSIHSFGRDEDNFSEKDLRERYGMTRSLEGDPIEIAPHQLRMAGKFISIDSEALPWMVLYKDKKILDAFPMSFPGQSEKVVMYRIIAQRIQSLGANGFLFSGEIWTKHHPDRKRKVHSNDETYYSIREDRDEALAVCAASHDGRQLTMVQEIVRNEEGWPETGRVRSYGHLDQQWAPLLNAISGFNSSSAFYKK